MSITLAHIQEDQVHESVLNTFCNSISISVLKIDYCVDISKPSVSFSIYLAGIKIGGCILDSTHQSCTIGGGAAGFKAEVTLTLDIPNKQIKYEILLCAPIVGCKKYSGTLFHWATFETI